MPVHLGVGVWGTLAVAFFCDPLVLNTGLGVFEQFISQLLGVTVCGVFVFVVCYLVFSTINKIWPLRVSLEDEDIGLNISEHGASTETANLLNTMRLHEETGDLSARSPVEALPTLEK